MYSKLKKKKKKWKNEKNIKVTKSFLNLLRSGQRNCIYSKVILKYKNDIKKTWQVIKEAIRKEKYKQQNLPKKIIVNKKSISETKSVAENFNKYFTQIDSNLAKDVGASTRSFNEYMKKHGSTQSGKVISVNEFKDAFKNKKIKN